MKMLSLKYFVGVFILCTAHTDAIFITTADWINWLQQNPRTYPTTAASSAAQYNYNYNKKLINNHNIYEQRGLRTFTLRENQFTDTRLINFNEVFPKTTRAGLSNTTAISPPPVVNAPPEFDPTVNLGMTIAVENQGRLCSSGWAYAVAKAVEILHAQPTATTMPERLSAQNLIDCSGGSVACTRQVSQTAFEYLAVYNQGLHLESNYRNQNTTAQSGMCIPPTGTALPTVGLISFSRIPEGDDATMLRYVGAGYPVVIEFDPTSFEFMHYGGGVFQQPRTSGGSHFMTVIGFGRDTMRQPPLDYWIVQNSFGTQWGEGGRIRIIRNAANLLAKSALFPVETI